MDESNLNVTRRKFMLLSSAAIGSPLLLNLPGTVPDAQAAAKSTKTGKIYFINRTCIGCQVCRMFCPGKAIRFGDCQNEIDQDKCLHCGTCYNECPICAISETEL